MALIYQRHFTVATPQSRRRGFTLIELLVVIAIISLLVSILLPSLNQAKQLAKATACMSQLAGIGKALAIYANDNDGFYPLRPCWHYGNRAGGPLCNCAEQGIKGYGSCPYFLFVDRSPNYSCRFMGLGLLWRWGYIDDGHIFYCPAADRLGYMYERNFMTDRYSPIPDDRKQNGQKTYVYSIFCTDRAEKDSVNWDNYPDIGGPDSRMESVGTHVLAFDYLVDWHGEYRRNVLYGDGAVLYTTDDDPDSIYNNTFCSHNAWLMCIDALNTLR
jgi:prepilin-type N-terminal cleavage/methylation domain-containing protein